MKRLSIVLALAAAAGCGKKVDSKGFEANLKKRTEDLGITNAKVSCPSGVEAKVGATFECTVNADGQDYVLVATITKVDGTKLDMDTKWKNGNAVMTGKLAPALQKELGAQFGTAVTVDCGKGPMLFLDKDNRATCDLAAGDTKAKVKVDFDKDLNATTWVLDPMLLAKAKLEQILTDPVRAKTSPTATVTCGDKPLLARPADGTVVCDLTDGDKKAKLNVAVDESLRVKSWDVVQ